MSLPMDVDPPTVSRKRTSSSSSPEGFREKMIKFNTIFEIAGIEPMEYAWAMAEKNDSRPLTTARHFPQDQLTAKVSPTHFLDRTVDQINHCGGGKYISVEVAEFVFQRTIKYMNVYCNVLYTECRKKDRHFINYLDIHKFFRQERLAYRNFLKHFYPDPKVDVNKVRHRMTLFLHNGYRNMRRPEIYQLYNNEEMKAELMRLSRKMEINLKDYDYTGPYYQNAKISYIEVLDQPSARYAELFHEILGMPPIETDMIIALSHLAHQCISEMVRLAIEVAGVGVDLTLEHYKAGLEGTNDLIFEYDMSRVTASRESTPPRLLSPPDSEGVVEFYHDRKNQIDAKMFALELADRLAGKDSAEETDYLKFKKLF